MKLGNKGVSIAEVVVVLGLFALIATAFVQLNLMFIRSIDSTSLSVRGDTLTMETMEALRALRDESWSNLSNLTPDTAYYLSFSDAFKKWAISSSNTGSIDGVFDRSFRVYSVYRDAPSGSIVSSGGSYDGGTLRVESVVSWNDRGVLKNKKVISYLSNF